MHRKRLLCWKAYLPRSSWPTQPMTPIICARPSLPKARSPSSPTTRHGRSNIRSTSISMPSAISWSAASQNSNNSAASQPASKRQPEITLPSSLSQPSSYGCDKCPHHLAGLARGLHGVAAAAANQRGILSDRLRSADKITLHCIAALVREEGELLLGFHAFGDDRHLQAVTKADHGPNDRRRLRIAAEIHDKSAVDLDLVEWERLKVAQR